MTPKYTKVESAGFSKTIVVGGPHPTTSYIEVLKDSVSVEELGEKNSLAIKLMKDAGWD